MLIHEYYFPLAIKSRNQILKKIVPEANFSLLVMVTKATSTNWQQYDITTPPQQNLSNLFKRIQYIKWWWKGGD